METIISHEGSNIGGIKGIMEKNMENRITLDPKP